MSKFIPKAQGPRLLQGLNPRHREIMRRLALGQTHGRIAEDLEMSIDAVSIIVKSPLFIAELNKMMIERDDQVYDAMADLCDAQKDAVDALIETVKQRELPVLRYHAARDILNRTGVQKPKEVHVTQQHNSYEEILHEMRIKYSPARPEDGIEKRSPAALVFESEDDESDRDSND